MNQKTQCRTCEENRTLEERSEISFPKRLAKAISHRVEQVIQTEEAKLLMSNIVHSDFWSRRQRDKEIVFHFSEISRKSKPLYSPEIAAELRQKLTK